MLPYDAAIRALEGEQVTIASGIVRDWTADDDWGVSLLVELDDGRKPIARPAWLGGDGGNGVFHRVPIGSEVTVLMPGGNTNACIALIGGASASQRPPAGWSNDAGLWLVDEDRVRVQRPGTKDLEGVLKREFLNDLSTFLQSVVTRAGALVVTCGTVLALPDLTAADANAKAELLATAVQTFASGVLSAASNLKTPVDTSAAGLGAAPHCSDLLLVPAE